MMVFSLCTVIELPQSRHIRILGSTVSVNVCIIEFKLYNLDPFAVRIKCKLVGSQRVCKLG